jgi:hypothetical protein
MQKPRCYFASNARASFLSTEGSALLIVLCFVVLLTIVVAAFLTQSILHRQIFSARAGQTEVDVLASDTIEFMKADLRQEILSGSTNNPAVYSANNSSGVAVPLYIPSANQTVVPSRTGFVPGPVTTDPYANIVKISKYQTNFFGSVANPSAYITGTYPSPNYASPSSTGDSSLNGRYIDNATTGWTTNGWDKPQLIDTTAYPNALQSGQIPLPDWIYVTTSGRKPTAITAPEPDVVGRYAYVVYDEGGLLDVNSAGCDSTKMSPADAYDVARKASLGFADLTQIPGINTTIQQALVAWRNHTTSSTSYAPAATSYPTNAPGYLQYLVDSSLNKGFLKASPGDQRFLSRQDLIAYAPTLGMPTQSLAYLGTFSRAINAPTWTPGDVSTETLTVNGSPTTYAANAESGTWVGSGQAEPVYNRDIINVRWPADVTFTRPKLDDDTGTLTETVTFHKGDPVVQHRFPLSKIALLSNPAAKTSSASSQGTVAWAVLYYFGLKWDTTGDASNDVRNPAEFEPHWEYCNCRNFVNGDGTAGSGVKYQNSIAEVAVGSSTPENTIFKNREPDFFEMLQAGILRGSTSEDNLFDIGLCAIDQATPSDVPDLMSLAPGGANREWIGRKNLPYFCEMLFWPYRPKYDPNRDTIEAYFVPVLWNPHRNASTPSTTVTNFRIYLYYSHGGGIWATLTPAAGNAGGTNPATSEPWLATTPIYAYSTANDPVVSPSVTANNYIINFNTSADSFAEPTILNASDITSPVQVPIDQNTGSAAGGLSEALAKGNGRWGFFLGSEVAPDAAVRPALVPPKSVTSPSIAVPWPGPPPTGTPTTWPATTTMTVSGNQSTGTGIWYRLQCQDSSGAWHSYSEMNAGTWDPAIQAIDTIGACVNLTGALGTPYNSKPSFSALLTGQDAFDYVGAISMGLLDPRVNVAVNPASTRMGSGNLWIASTQGAGVASIPQGSTLRPFPSTSSIQQSQPIGRTTPNNTFTLSGGWGTPASFPIAYGQPPGFNGPGNFPGMYSENSLALSSPTLTYADNGGGAIVYSGSSGTVIVAGDGVTRPGDGINGAFPMATSLNGGVASGGDRPVILDRPFLSVGELGYTFRAIEWKTLDFSSALSGDSGLLDLFSVNDAENVDQQSMISGVVNINTHNPAVLQSILSGGLINGVDSTGAGITATDAQKMANAIVTETVGNQPLINRSELATRIVPLTAISGTASPVGVLTSDGYVTKDRREALVRALAEPADTRTWNLLIDLVVQAGRYPPTAINAGNTAALSQFDVQGERRYWLHVAIDRYTGKVIDEQLEVVHDN